MIPQNQQAAVKNALQTAFETDQYDDITAMTTGLTNALTYRVTVKNKPYLLKIARADSLSNPDQYYASMKAGAEAGIAPRVLYLNTESKILITDFIETKPFPIEKARETMPKILRTLHALPPFPGSVNYFDSMDRLVQAFTARKFLHEELTEELIRMYSRVKDVYPCHAQGLVSCHNDLKPENILFDGERAWLADWEAAFLNDCYVDLSIVANFVVENEEDESRYLHAYFGEMPSSYQKARFFLMQQLLHVFYAAIFILYASKTVSIRMDDGTTDYRDFHRRMWQGEIDLASDVSKLQYALVHLRRFLSNVSTERFEESLRILAEAAK